MSISYSNNRFKYTFTGNTAPLAVILYVLDFQNFIRLAFKAILFIIQAASIKNSSKELDI